MKKEDKKKVVQELHERAQKAEFAVLTDFRGLNVATMSALRKNLREASVDYQVAKNTLITRAIKGTGIEILKDYLKGPCAIAFSYGDPVAPAKVLTAFAKDNKNFTIKTGVLSGKEVDLAGIKSLAALPSREVLLGQMAGALNAVPTGFVRALADVPRRLLNVLNAINEQKEAA